MLYLAECPENESDDLVTEIFRLTNLSQFISYFVQPDETNKPKLVADIKFLQLIWRLDSGRSRHPLPHCDFNAYEPEKPCNPRTIDSIRLAYADKEFTDKSNKECGSFYGEPRWDIIQNLELVVPLLDIFQLDSDIFS